jgi:DNA-binding NarL/FixJ family response regulator
MNTQQQTPELMMTPARQIRVLCVDDHPLVLEGLRARLADEHHIEVVAEASDAVTALERLDTLDVDVVLLDIGMKDVNGIELARRILDAHPKVGVLMLSMYDTKEHIDAAIAAGARGYVIKDEPAWQIGMAIRAVAAGRSYYSPTAADRLLGPKTAEQSLSRREQDILSLLAKGMSSKSIAGVLHISVRTVETHRMSIRRKLNLGGQAELIKFAVERLRR